MKTKLILCLLATSCLFAQTGSEEERHLGNVHHSVIGLEQGGASSAKSDQRFFFDFHAARALPGRLHGILGPRWRWWGNVRIASYPQQITTPVAEFSAKFSEQVGQLKVNELADFGEFRTGLEFRLTGSPVALIPDTGARFQRSALSVFAYFGALGQLNSPNLSMADRVPVFQLPVAGSPQKQRFDQVFPASQYTALNARETRYLGLTTPERDRFFRQYGAGLRLTTFFFEDALGMPQPGPAMVAVSLGQNELVSGGYLRGVVTNVEGIYPLRVLEVRKSGEQFVLYLFGRANLRISGSRQTTPLLLQPATGISAADPRVAVIAQPSNRDMYSIGVGVDVVALISKAKKNGENGKAGGNGGK